MNNVNQKLTDLQFTAKCKLYKAFERSKSDLLENIEVCKGIYSEKFQTFDGMAENKYHAEQEKDSINEHSLILQNEMSPDTKHPSTPGYRDTGKHQCLECFRSFANKHYLKNHMRVHSKDRPYTCIICNKRFKVSYDLDKHMVIHDDNRPKHKCDICEKEYNSANYLQVHMRVHRKERPYSCIHCNKTFTYQSAQQAHIKTHQDVSERAVHECNICGKKYTKSSALEVHKRKHTGERPYKCSECGKSFAAHSTLYSHLKNMHSDEDASGTCPICNKVFRKKSYIPHHIKSSHQHIKEHKCPYCEESFSRPYSVKVHVKSAHEEPKFYKCDQCNRNFNNLSHFKIHKKTHEGIKDFQCDLCNRTFGQKCHLTVHLRKAHKEFVPVTPTVECQICGRIFSNLVNLNRHVKKMHNSKLSVTPVLMHPQSESESSLHQPDEIEKYNKMQVKSHTDTSSETEKDDGHIQEMNYWDEQEDASEDDDSLQIRKHDSDIHRNTSSSDLSNISKPKCRLNIENIIQKLQNEGHSGLQLTEETGKCLTNSVKKRHIAQLKTALPRKKDIRKRKKTRPYKHKKQKSASFDPSSSNTSFSQNTGGYVDTIKEEIVNSADYSLTDSGVMQTDNNEIHHYVVGEITHVLKVEPLSPEDNTLEADNVWNKSTDNMVVCYNPQPLTSPTSVGQRQEGNPDNDSQTAGEESSYSTISTGTDQFYNDVDKVDTYNENVNLSEIVGRARDTPLKSNESCNKNADLTRNNLPERTNTIYNKVNVFESKNKLPLSECGGAVVSESYLEHSSVTPRRPSIGNSNRQGTEDSSTSQILNNSLHGNEQSSFTLEDLTSQELLRILEQNGEVNRCDCSLIFTNEIIFYLHRNVHGSGGKLRCGFCGHEASDKYFFMIHQIHEHGCGGNISKDC